MDNDSFFSMSDDEFNKMLSLSESNPASKRRMFTGRKFTLIAKKNGETKTFENVGRTVINRMKESLKEEGFYRFDIIETKTIVNETVNGEKVAREMEFGKQVFTPAETKFQPENLPEDEKPRQKTIAWEYFGEKLDDTWLDNRPITKVADRTAKIRAERKRMEIFNRINAKNASKEKMKIFNRINGNFLFSSEDENEIVGYMKENNLKKEEVVLYVSNEVYEMLKGMEK